MNLRMTVKMLLVFLLLCLGFFNFSFTSRLRHFTFNAKYDNRSTVLSECKEANASLVTLFDEEDLNFTVGLISKLPKTNTWLGLKMKGDKNMTWSDGRPVQFKLTSLSVDITEQKCLAIHNETWEKFNCSERKPFMCYNGSSYQLINESKTWCQALKHCKNNNSTLVSIHNDTQNEDVSKEGQNTSFWIGLMLDDWEWEDKSCSSFRKWDETKKREPGENCTAISKESPNQLLFHFNCGGSAQSFCSTGDVRIRVIQKPLTWEEAFDYCRENHSGLLWMRDESDQDSVEQWLKYTNATGPFWIGLRQSRVFGFWIWTSDTFVTESNWEGGRQPELPLSNHCGVVTKENKWKDEDCLLQLPFLCEEEIIYMKNS